MNKEELQEFIQKQKEMLISSYEQAKSHSNIIMMGGYVGLFAYLVFLPVFALAVGDANPGLLLAVRSSNAAAVQAELAKGVDVNQTDKDGYTALMFSVYYGFAKMDIVNSLLKHGANVNAQANDGMTALMLAAGAASGGASPDAVRALLDHGADPNLKGRLGWTALFYAVQGGRIEVVKALLDKGADATNGGRTIGERPLTLAIESGRKDIADLLKAHGAREFNRYPNEWQQYRNVAYQYSITYPPEGKIESNELDSTNGQLVSKPLDEVSSIVIALPAVSYPTNQGAPKPVMVQYSLSIRVDVKANPSRLAVEKWLQAQTNLGLVIGMEKISLHGLSAIKLKRSLLVGNPETCVFVGGGAWIYQICFREPDGAPQAIQESTQQTFERMLQSFELTSTQSVGDVAKQCKPYGVDNEWRTCSTDQDCVAALRGCWAWEPINKKYLPQFMGRNPPACLQSTPPGSQPVVACVNKVCVATDQSTGVTWTDWLRSQNDVA
jgi:hypothetical protein